ncbi:MAG: HAMP domain-containing protein [Deltaproteobacteria bacterium]|nr:HAMP domain-containing protein [Deltaproteobacteria bacterium]
MVKPRQGTSVDSEDEVLKRGYTGSRGKFLLWVRRIPLRTRLILAFFTLIITSASATVAIGDAVFGRTTFSLATSKMKLGLKLAELALRSQMDTFNILASYYAYRVSRFSEPPDLCEFAFTADVSADLSLIYKQETISISRFFRRSDDLGARRASVQAAANCGVNTENPSELVGSSIADLARFVQSAKKPYSGFIELDARSSGFLRGEKSGSKSLVLVSAAPMAQGGVFLIGSFADNRANFLSPVLSLSFVDQKEDFVASLFLGNQRVSTLMGINKTPSPLDDKVAKTVLERGRTYVGVSDQLNPASYAAAKPIRDFRNRPIGVLAVEAPEAYYFDMKQQTVSLFAGLIAIGMIFGFFISYLFSGLLIRPVSELAKGMQRVAEGDLDYKIRVASSDDLGKLSKAFNRMVTNIRERDVRLREMTNEQLSQVDKQVSIGRLAAGVAHEINNPLTSVLSLSMLMLKELKEGDPKLEDLKVIVEETTRCRTIVRSLLDFAREVPSEKKRIDVNQVIRDTFVLVRRYDSMEGVDVSLKLAAEPLFIAGDSEQLRQVFANILINAAEASNNQGRIAVTTDEDSSGGFAIIRIRDRGMGIPKENLGSVFQPFFTTKGAKKGTGLGLSVSQGIIAKHRGTIELASEEGKGTTVTILLPRDSEDRPRGRE